MQVGVDGIRTNCVAHLYNLSSDWDLNSFDVISAVSPLGLSVISGLTPVEDIRGSGERCKPIVCVSFVEGVFEIIRSESDQVAISDGE